MASKTPMMNCPKCNEPMFFTGEVHPTIIPQRWYACINRHVLLRYDEHTPDWGDRTITKRWREELKRGGWSDYETVGRYPPC